MLLPIPTFLLIYLNLLLSFLDYKFWERDLHFWEIFVIIFEFQKSKLRNSFESARGAWRARFQIFERISKLSTRSYTIELFHERAIPWNFFTKGLYRWTFSRKGCTVELFHERLNKIRNAPLRKLIVIKRDLSVGFFGFVLRFCKNVTRAWNWARGRANARAFLNIARTPRA